MFKSFLAKIISVVIGVAAIFIPAHSATTTPIISRGNPQTVAQIATSTSTTKFISKKVTAKPIPIAVTTPTPEATTTQTATSPETPPDFAAINAFARTAIVNILCIAKGDELSPISGTGIIVSSDGIILTNAHIAQYFLLRNYEEPDFVDCVIRTGSPAQATYNAELAYISPTWIQNNKSVLKEDDPTGTGKNDFGFLHITSAINGSPLPTSFPHIPLDIRENIAVGEPVLLVSYPAGFLGGETILQNLNVASGETSIGQLFTYATDTTDIISVPGTVVSQRGSSGGAVIDTYASVIGMISLSSTGNTTSSRDLYAITSAYINRDLQSELGMTLADFLDQDISAFAQKFQTTTAPLLTQILTEDLNTTTPAN